MSPAGWLPSTTYHHGKPLYSTVIDVETPTHIASTLQFASGAIGTIITSFDVW